MKIIFTKDPTWLKKWDTFISNEDKGSHLLLSDWVFSYRSYGFDADFCLCIVDDEIVGGYAAVIAKASLFKFYVVPFGPIVGKGFEMHLNALIASVLQRAKKFKACYTHISLTGNNTDDNAHVMKNGADLPSLKMAVEGHLFKYVYSSNGLNWLSLKDFGNEEMVLESFKSSVRRDIRSALRKEMDLKFLHSEDELKAGYAICLDNAAKHQYALRDWPDFKETLMNLVEKGNAKFLAAYKDGDLKGAILLVKAGNFYTYILGGTKKEKPDLLAGHLLQWEAIKLSMLEKADGYNISLGGSKGVMEFKNGFGTSPVLFENSKFHWVLRPAFFKIYGFVEKSLKPHKKLVSKALSMFKR